MNDKEITDYTNLIKAIKDSPVGQEWETLNQYPDLINQDLIKSMKQAIYVLANRGDKKEADRFVKLVIQLKDNLSEADPQVQFKKLRQQKIIVYANLIKAIKDSPAGQEWETLNQYPDLIDQDLIKSMKQAIYVLANRGDKEEVDRFVKLVIQLKDKLSEADLQVQLKKQRKQWEQLSQQTINLYQQGEFTQGIAIAEQVLELARYLWGKNHPNVATSCNNLAQLYKSQGRYSEAEPLYLEAVAIDRQALSPNHPSLATHLNNLAGLYKSQGRYNEAEPLYLEAVAIDRQALSSNHPDLATHLNNLAGLYESQGRYNEAEPLYLEAIAILQNSLGSDHPNTITVRNNLKTFWEVGIEAGIFDVAVLQENPLFRELLAEALELDE